MTVEKLLKMSPQDIDRMDKQSLSKVVVQLKSSANKRLARIHALGSEAEDIPAYRQFKKAHSYAEKFESVKGKTAEELAARERDTTECVSIINYPQVALTHDSPSVVKNAALAGAAADG